MSFGLPAVLLLLIPVGIFWSMEIRRRVSLAPHWPKVYRLWAGPDRLDMQPHSKPPRQRWRLWLGLGLAAIALALPRWGHANQPLFSQPRDVVVALDLSRSMESRDVEPSRLDHAKYLIQSMLDEFAGERVALVLFARSAFVQIPLTSDYEVLESSLPDLNPAYFPHSSTSFGPVLQRSIDAFGPVQTGERFLVLLTDGEGFDEDWRPFVPQLRDHGIRVIAVGLGRLGGGAIPDGEGGTIKDAGGNEVTTQLKPGVLQELARETHGLYIEGNDFVDMTALMKQAVAAGGQAGTVRNDKALPTERFQYFLLPAVILLLLSYWREFPVRPRSRELKFKKLEAKAAAVRPVVVIARVLIAGFLLGLGRSPARAQDGAPAMAVQSGDMDESALNNVASNTHVAPAGAFGEMLKKRVEGIVNNPSPNAYDYSSLAIDTITYVQGTLRIRKQVPMSVIDDALSALRLGQSMDAQGGNWPQLTNDLLELRRQNLLPPKVVKPDKATAQEQLEMEQEEKEGRKSGGGHKNSGEDDAVGYQPPTDPDDAKKDLHFNSAFGDFKDAGPVKIDLAIPPENLPPAADMQKIRSAASQVDQETALNPELALPLQKLQLVRHNDAPGRFFQMLDDDKDAAVSTGPEW
jgi:Ca-activated chloride channel family protein